MSRPVVLVALLFVATAVAGCVGDVGGPGAVVDAGDDLSPVEATTIALAERGVAGRGAVTWNGSTLAAGATEEVAFEVAPTGDRVPEQLVVSATWDPYRLDGQGIRPRGELDVRIVSADGDALAVGEGRHWSAVAVLTDPEPGNYTAEIRGDEGETPYVGSVHVQDRPDEEPLRDLLPDLVTMPPMHLTRQRPRGGPTPADDAAGTRGCTTYEMSERGARNCLRFTTSVGNLGVGPLEVELGFRNATEAMTPLGSRFVQVVHGSDGETRRIAGGQAEYHPTHRHYHYHGFAEFTLYEHDARNGSRGEVVREGRKSGWCVVDMGLVAPSGGHRTLDARYPLQGSRNPVMGGSNCRAAAPGFPMVTGITPGWYDMYEWNQGDQYVEVTDLPDGTYELVTEADPDGNILESDPANNAAGVVFAWEDGEAEVLDRWSDGVDV